jgi:hypothetical protein
MPHFLDNRLTDIGKVVVLTHQPRSTPQKHYVSVSGTHFCLRLSEPQGLVRLKVSGKLKKKIIHVIRSQTRNFPACSLVPEPLRYRVTSEKPTHLKKNFRSANLSTTNPS